MKKKYIFFKGFILLMIIRFSNIAYAIDSTETKQKTAESIIKIREIILYVSGLCLIVAFLFAFAALIISGFKISRSIQANNSSELNKNSKDFMKIFINVIIVSASGSILGIIVYSLIGFMI